MQILAAKPEHLDALSQLFDRYRQFYGKTSNLALAEDFVRARLEAQDTQFFIARTSNDATNGQAAGFTQLFPSFSSVAGTRTLILNDLYVEPSLRGQGIGRALMRRATDYACDSGFAGIKLETQQTNKVGQALYESEGYQRLNGFYQYFLNTPKNKNWLERLRGR